MDFLFKTTSSHLVRKRSRMSYSFPSYRPKAPSISFFATSIPRELLVGVALSTVSDFALDFTPTAPNHLSSIRTISVPLFQPLPGFGGTGFEKSEALLFLPPPDSEDGGETTISPRFFFNLLRRITPFARKRHQSDMLSASLFFPFF